MPLPDQGQAYALNKYTRRFFCSEQRHETECFLFMTPRLFIGNFPWDARIPKHQSCHGDWVLGAPRQATSTVKYQRRCCFFQRVGSCNGNQHPGPAWLLRTNRQLSIRAQGVVPDKPQTNNAELETGLLSAYAIVINIVAATNSVARL